MNYIERYFPSLDKFKLYCPDRDTELFDLENDPGVDFIDGKFILRSTNETFFSIYNRCNGYRKECTITPCKYGFWYLCVSYDPSPPGKDYEWIYERVLFHKNKGLIDQRVFLENEEEISSLDLRFLNFGLISNGRRFYNTSLKKVFELPNWISRYYDFDENSQLASFSVSHNVLIRLVAGKLYCIINIDGIGYWPSFYELRHHTPFLFKGGVDNTGNKVVPWDNKFYPTILNQYVVVGEDFNHYIANQYNEKICGCQRYSLSKNWGVKKYIDGRLCAYNDYFYALGDGSKPHCVYNIYGDLIFEDAECDNICLQDNLTFIVSYHKSRGNTYFLYNHRGECLTDEGYSWLRNFSCGRAFFVKEGKWGFLKYIFNDKVVELYLKDDNEFLQEIEIPDFKYNYIEWKGLLYNIDMEKIDNVPPYCGLEHNCQRLEDGSLRGETFIYANGEKVEIDDDIYISEDLGNGFFLGRYSQEGHFDINGNIVDLTEERKLPLINSEVVFDYENELLGRKSLDQQIGWHRL